MKLLDTTKYIGITLLATILSFLFHELAHWVSYQLMGFDAGATINTAFVLEPEVILSPLQNMISDAAGPIFTILQAITFYFIIKKNNNKILYPFLLVPFSIRLGATYANSIMPNDEGRISLALGLNLYVISALVVTFLLVLLILLSRKNNYSITFNLLIFFISVLGMAAVSYFDSIYHLRII